MNLLSIKQSIIQSGVKNLKDYGYPSVTPENILTDKIYAAFFLGMLNDNLGVNNQADVVIHDLIDAIKSNEALN